MNIVAPKSNLSILPNEPGVYQYFDKNNELLYIGKAKNLKNRISSYFTSNLQSRKTSRLVSQIHSVNITIVHSEFDALLLENILIKKHQPKYNILLRDDKTYPFICITNEPFPKLITTRKIDKNIGKFYGPFANPRSMNVLIELIHQLFPIRTCNLNLSEEKINNGNYRVCLEYHIGNCKGPCENLQKEVEYLGYIQQIHSILKGNYVQAKSYFQDEMIKASESLNFEKAQEFKEKYEQLENFQAKSTIVNPSINDVDVFSIVSDHDNAYLNFMKIINGTIIQAQTWDIKKRMEEDDADILTMIVWEKRNQFQSEAKEIITNIPLSIELENLSNTIPQIGDKKKLIDLSLKNVLYYRKEKLERKAAAEGGGDPKARVLFTLQNELALKTLPKRIECFDNSNLQGTNPVSALVCFLNGRPAKKEYRLFTPKTVEGPNDFATMKEVVFRRYKRVIEEELELPDLLIIDGGKGQLSSSVEALKQLDLYGKIPIIGIAKRLEEIYFPEDSIPIYIDKRSESLKLIQQLRDEAHRFGITAHRNKRSKNFLISQLEEIDGIGKLTAQKLMKVFGSIKNLKNAPLEEIEKVVGKKKAPHLINQLNNWME
ncbi:MAG: hypothetical protein RIR51_828 [Bacteroidota bacterium]|jgi:excinuclease ABC subunit C